MKRMICFIAAICIIALVSKPIYTFAATHYSYGDSIAYVTSDEWWINLGYDGYMYIDSAQYSSFWGGYMSGGYIKYSRNGKTLDIQYASSSGSSSVLTASCSVWDQLNPFASDFRIPTQFNWDMW